MGEIFLNQHLSGEGNIVIFTDPGFGPPDDPPDDLFDLELDGADVPVPPYQLIAVAQHAPFGDCWIADAIFRAASQRQESQPRRQLRHDMGRLDRARVGQRRRQPAAQQQVGPR